MISQSSHYVKDPLTHLPAVRGRRPSSSITLPSSSLGHSNTRHLDVTGQRSCGELPSYGHDQEQSKEGREAAGAEEAMKVGNAL